MKLLTTVLASAVFLAAETCASIYDRPLHLVYADDTGPRLDNSDEEIQRALGQVKNNITALCPFFLNVGADGLAKYASMIEWAEASNIVLFPAVGGSTANGAALNTPANQQIAQGYRNIPSAQIRLENLTGFYSNNASDVLDFIDYCIGLGFSNIMLNPWPYASGGVLATFPKRQLPYLKSAFQQVESDWEINTNTVNQINAMQPSMNIVVNYESPGPQDTLAAMERQTPGSSEKAFDTTLAQLASLPATDNLHWCPPFTAQYDPLDFTPPTWPFIASKLSSFQS